MTISHYVTFKADISNVSILINANGSLVTINNNLKINNNNTLTVYGLLQVNNLTFDNGGDVYFDTEIVVDITGNFEIKNNSAEVVIDGQVNVGLNFSNGNNGIVSGNGQICVDGSYLGVGLTFGIEPTSDIAPNICMADGVLPVELLSFSANVVENEVLLSWITASEINNDYFEAQKSTDGVVFKTVSIVTRSGTSHTKISYTCTDSDISKGTAYYRLKQVDFNGKFEYTNVLTVVNENTGLNEINTCYNNSTRELQISLSCEISENVSVQIINVNGQLITSEILKVEKGSNTFSLPLNLNTSGIYFINIGSEEQNHQSKILSII